MIRYERLLTNFHSFSTSLHLDRKYVDLIHTTARWHGYWSFPHTTKRSEYLLFSTKLDIRLISCQNLTFSFFFLILTLGCYLVDFSVRLRVQLALQLQPFRSHSA